MIQYEGKDQTFEKRTLVKAMPDGTVAEIIHLKPVGGDAKDHRYFASGQLVKDGRPFAEVTAPIVGCQSIDEAFARAAESVNLKGQEILARMQKAAEDRKRQIVLPNGPLRVAGHA